MFLNIEAFIDSAGSRSLCPLTSPLSKNLVERTFSSPIKEPNPWLSTDKGQENTDVMKTQLPLLPMVEFTVKFQLSVFQRQFKTIALTCNKTT